MYVSTAKVLRKFAEKVAGRRPFDMDEQETAAYARSRAAKAQAASDAATAKSVAKEDSASRGIKPNVDTTYNAAADSVRKQNPLEADVNSALGARGRGGVALAPLPPEMSTPEWLQRKLLRAAGGVVDAGKSVGGLVAASPGYAALGAGLGGAGLYGLARMLQSEEDKKKRQPMLAPALGAAGGAVALPALLAALSAQSPAATQATASGSAAPTA